jgi:hypothetical protein
MLLGLLDAVVFPSLWLALTAAALLLAASGALGTTADPRAVGLAAGPRSPDPDPYNGPRRSPP